MKTPSTIQSVVSCLFAGAALFACSAAPAPEAAEEQGSDLLRPCGTHCPKPPPPPAVCGAEGSTCCEKTVISGFGTPFVYYSCTDPSLMCSPSHVCVENQNPAPPCGQLGEVCCPGYVTTTPYCTDSTTQCGPDGTCEPPPVPPPCGAFGQECCYVLPGGVPCRGLGGICQPDGTTTGACVVSPDLQDPVGGCTRPVTFTTHGGGSMGGVTLVPVEWGFGNAAFTAKLEVTYNQIANSNYYAWLGREYGAPTLNHHPVVAATGNTAPYATGGIVQESIIQDELDSLVRGNQIPTPSNAVYVIHMSPGTIVNLSNGQKLCGDLGGDNGKFDRFNALSGGVQTRYYILMPDPSTCGAGYDGFTTALSHEIAEMTTDPNSNGWRDTTQPSTCNGHEVGDLCNGITTTITTPYAQADTGSTSIVVQKLWSNKLNACVTEDVAGAPFD